MTVDWLSNSIILPELHAALGAGVVFGAYLLLSRLPPRLPDGSSRHAWNRWAVGAFLVIDLLKETLWDPVHEVDNPFLWQGVTDFGWYLVGVAIALALVFARFRKI